MTRQSCQLFGDSLSLRFETFGAGETTFLLLHGGAGPASVIALGTELATRARVIVPTHPGFDGTSRPDWCCRVSDLALAYLALLDQCDATNVVLVGNSFGGWLAAELALHASPRVRAAALLNAVGIEGNITDPSTRPPNERLALSFHSPARGLEALGQRDEATLRGDQQALRAYSGQHFMHDPDLEARLSTLTIPTLVLWGESDRIVNCGYGRRFAAAIPGADFRVVPRAGHFPHLERPDMIGSALLELAAS
jgi:pimeloyl-ACP methyl ester carboxylesterase